MVWFAYSATFASWVMSKIVFPFSAFNFLSSCIISIPVLESKAPVGSSASKSPESVTKALAIHTLCCWPQESWLGRAFSLPSKPTSSFFGLSRGDSHIGERQNNLFPRRHSLEQIIALENETDRCPTDHRLLIRSQIFYLIPTKKIRAWSLNIKKTYNIHQGWFSAARWSHNRNKISIIDI